jgi:hypothetical protein
MANEIVKQEISFAKLYPISIEPGITAIVQSVLLDEKSSDGKPLLSRALVPQEREILRERFGALSGALQSATRAQIVQRVTRMFMGFQGPDMTRAQATVVANQFAIVLSDLPMWAIERACLRFERGEVTSDDILDGVNQRRGPTTAHLHTEARSLVGHFYAEHRKVHDALKGVVQYKPTPEERERVKAGLDGLAADLKAKWDLTDKPNWSTKGLPSQEEQEERHAEIRRRYPPKAPQPEGPTPGQGSSRDRVAGQR